MINITPQGLHFRVTEDEVEDDIEQIKEETDGLITHSSLDRLLSKKWFTVREFVIREEAIIHLRSLLPSRSK